MPCLICKGNMHATRECTSNHAQTMEDAVSNWIINLLKSLYSTPKYREDVHWISGCYHLKQLSKGDLLYLNRHTLMDDPMYTNEKLIYIYLHYIVWTFYQMYHTGLHEKIQRIIRIDVLYWNQLANSIYSVEEATMERQIALHPPYHYVKKENTQEEMDCPVCLDERICKKNTHQYNCAHSICLKCSDELLTREQLKCPLCRTEIQTVSEFTL